MDNKDWSDFNEELDKHLETIKDTFLNKTLSFNDDLIRDNEGDKETEKDKNKRNQELLNLLHEEDGEAKLIEKVNTILKAKDDQIGELKKAFNDNKEKLSREYEENQNKCERSCQVIRGYLGDKDGFIHFLSKAFQNQHIGDQGELKTIKEVVEKKKNDYDCSFCCKSVILTLLVVFCIVAQVYLYSQLKVCTCLEGVQGCDVLANCILIVAMILLLVGEIFLIHGIIKLAKKKNSVLQRMELILNKIDMHKVSKFELDRELEKLLEEMNR